jgi:AcrR family transcriptional regulator
VHEGDHLSPRARQIVEAARGILECEGRDALTMRRLAAELGIRAPSLYKHFPDKAAVEVALIEIGMVEWAAALESELSESADPVAALGRAYRGFALSHPHLYRLITEGRLPRDRMRPGVEQRAAAPVLHVFQNAGLARAAWAFAHGMTILELDGRFPPDADLDAAWDAGLTAFGEQIEPAAFALPGEAG